MTGSPENLPAPSGASEIPANSTTRPGVNDPPAPRLPAVDTVSKPPDQNTSAGTDARADAPVDSPKKGAGEAFRELADTVDHLAVRIDEINEFVRICKEKLLREAEVYRQDGAKPFLEVLMQLHDLIFRQAQSMESGRDRPDPFVTNLFQTLEAELASLGIHVIRPAPGDQPDLELMKAIATEPCPFWRKPDRVARIHSCGFDWHQDDQWQLIRKAEISVYRK